MLERRHIYPFMGLALVSLLIGIWAGLTRMGYQRPAIAPILWLAHGPLMVSGFLGTLIGLERAVAMPHRWPYAAPLLSGVGALLLLLSLLLGLPDFPARVLLVLSSVGLVVIMGTIARRHPASFTLTMAGGALCWLIGNVAWTVGEMLYQAVPWWAAFLVLTIAGERLELSRVMRLTQLSQGLFLAPVGLLAVGLTLSVLDYTVGIRVFGVGMIALAAWLFRYDIARRTVRQQGLTRFIAVCLLLGYAWLGLGGAMSVVWGSATAGPLYDAILHSIFIGFVVSMIFGHAPIIFPGVLRRPIDYLPTFYLPLGLLQLSLALRVAGDLLFLPEARLWGGIINGMAIVLYLVMLLTSRSSAPTRPSL